MSDQNRVYADVANARFPNEKRVKAWMESAGGESDIPAGLLGFASERDTLDAQIAALKTQRKAVQAEIEAACHHPTQMLKMEHDYWEDSWSKAGHTTEHLKCLLCGQEIDKKESSWNW